MTSLVKTASVSVCMYDLVGQNSLGGCMYICMTLLVKTASVAVCICMTSLVKTASLAVCICMTLLVESASVAVCMYDLVGRISLVGCMYV